MGDNIAENISKLCIEAGIPVTWEISPRGYTYINGSFEDIKNLYVQLCNKNYNGKIYLYCCGGCLYYTPVDKRWKDPL